ncbi:hypothetical protein J437_LFUL015013 [Ladona fulva]|uniref:Trophoblast glycoprotein n=1 Tax=Ladona fulva TaxID=123851 RepID=A0A8K0P6T8_LADFU|nr:hypothetical protein J437_LFUL015013 [Ladona fulva]
MSRPPESTGEDDVWQHGGHLCARHAPTVVDSMSPSLHLIPFLVAVSFALVHFACGKADHPRASSSHRGECPPAFKGLCTCGETQFQARNQFVVNCTNAMFTDTQPLAHLPKETQVLLYTGNNIPELKGNIFGEIDDETNEGVPYLRVVDLSNNGISTIRGKAFHRVSSVERLILNHNRIVLHRHKNHVRMFSNFANLRELHLTNAFANPTESDEDEDDDDDDDSDDDDDDEDDDDLDEESQGSRGSPSPSYLIQLQEIFRASNLSRLEKLHLEQNEIESFAHVPDLFCSLPSLADLHLGDNKISGVNDLNLSCLLHLRFLDLEKNNIESLPQETLHKDRGVTPFFMVDLGGNNFSCDDCEKIMALKEWLIKTRVQVRNQNFLACHALRDVKCPNIPNIQLPSNKNLNEETHGSAAVAVTIFLCLSVVALAIGAAYMNRTWITAKMSPVIQTVTRKVQYTTIGRQEDEVREVNV